MKKDIVWIILVITALVAGFFGGYLLGTRKPVQPEDYSVHSAVGSYKTDSWNGKSAALVLKADGTCLYPTGSSGVWSQDGLTISIVLGSESTHEAELVEGGIILHGKLFERVG